MQNLLYNISQVLGITILHSLWQGLLIFIVLRLFLLARPATSSAIKYWVSYGALSVTLGWFVVTLFNELGHYQWLSTTALQITPLTLPAIIQEVNEPANKLYFTIARYMPYLTMLYVVGLVFNTLKLGLAWNSIYRIRQNSSDAGFENTVSRLSQRLKVTKFVKVAFSEWVDVPCVTGFIKPIILLPLSIHSYLSTKEIEAILMHELAHIKRNDYLLNFIQQVIGILLFFNPFARLITKIISEERENCCDDVVVHATGSPLIYAQALLKLEENKQHQWQLALAATTKKYELLNRIERIMKTKTQTVNIRPVLITVLALTCAITSIAWLNPEIKNGKIVIKNAPAIKKITAALSAPASPADTLGKTHKRKKSLTFKYAGGYAKVSDFSDTTIKGKKYKIVIEDENGNKKEYNSLKELPEKDRNEFVGKAANLEFALDSNSSTKYDNYFQSDVLKKEIETAQKLGMEMSKKMNTPEFKKAQKEMIAKSLAMVKPFNTPAFRKQQAEMVASSMEMAKKAYGPELQKLVADITQNATNPDYFNSDEFKKKTEKLSAYYESDDFKAGIEKAAKYYDSPEFKKQVAEMAKQFDSPAFKKQMEKAGKQFDSPEFKKQMKEMAKQFDSPAFKKQMEEMGKTFDKMGDKMDKDMSKSLDKVGDKLDKEINKAAKDSTTTKKTKTGQDN